MEEQRFLIVERHNDHEIRVIIDEKFDCGVLEDVCISNNGKFLPWVLNSKSDDKIKFAVENGEPYIIQSLHRLNEKDVCDILFKYLDFFEKYIDDMDNVYHENIDNRIIYIYTEYLGSLIELYVCCDYNGNRVWYSNGVSLKSVSLGNGLVTILNELKSIKEQIYISHINREHSDSLIGKIETIITNIQKKSYTKKYPELY